MMHVRVATTQTDLVPILQPLKKFVFWERDSETNFVDRLDRRMVLTLRGQLCVVFISTSSCLIEISHLPE